MKVVITGAGEVGYHLAKMLSSEYHDTYLVDQNEERLQYIASHIDIYTVVGDATHSEVLEESNIGSCDLLIAVTSSEKTNLLVCILGKKYGAKRTIARISDLDSVKKEKQEVYNSLGIDTLISPTLLASEEISRLVGQSAFTDSIEFEGGKLKVFGILVGKNSAIKDRSIIESAHHNPNNTFMPIAVHRNTNTVIARKNTIIKEGDILYFITLPESLQKVQELCGQQCVDIKNVMILGGNNLSLLTAKSLENKYRVIIVEKDKAQSEYLAEHLSNSLVLNIDGRDIESLVEEGLDDMDAVIALDEHSETNIISSLVAKNHGALKTIARVENKEYIHLSQSIGVDTLINKKIIAASEIFKYVRKGEVAAIASLHGVDAEIIEFKVKNKSKVTRKQIKDLKFPFNARIAGVVRNEQGIIPNEEFQLQEGDKAVVFALTEAIHHIEKYFQ